MIHFGFSYIGLIWLKGASVVRKIIDKYGLINVIISFKQMLNKKRN